MAPRSLGRDELGALRQLLELGSGSANVTTYLELTQAIVAEAYEALRDEQDAQRNPVEIPGATRYKTYQGVRVYRTKCPRLYGYSADSFQFCWSPIPSSTQYTGVRTLCPPRFAWRGLPAPGGGPRRPLTLRW